ncbi:hypothetical protein N825_21740 [Skermanella stibiiresistens SB22]|uniref:Uncharacterized protein n=1 Tax=Skermanella stibiiresistens SB22 TaxID=1385369 RepID=W9GWQ2_9PROT|nr:hypothetical protein N825_21740 [Skermanella stibiiresistens SB22]
MGWMAPTRPLCATLGSSTILSKGAPSMTKITTIGLDLAKRVFQVHGVDATGAVVLRKRLRREDVLVFFTQLPPCRIGMVACSTAHH